MNFKHWLQDFMMRLRDVSLPDLTLAKKEGEEEAPPPQPTSYRIHSGFWDALHLRRKDAEQSMMQEIIGAIHKIDNDQPRKDGELRKIYITGHSLGGALR